MVAASGLDIDTLLYIHFSRDACREAHFTTEVWWNGFNFTHLQQVAVTSGHSASQDICSSALMFLHIILVATADNGHLFLHLTVNNEGKARQGKANLQMTRTWTGVAGSRVKMKSLERKNKVYNHWEHALAITTTVQLSSWEVSNSIGRNGYWWFQLKSQLWPTASTLLGKILHHSIHVTIRGMSYPLLLILAISFASKYTAKGLVLGPVGAPVMHRFSRAPRLPVADPPPAYD